MIRIDDKWEYTPVWTDDFLHGAPAAETVRLPHSNAELPLHYIDTKDYEKVVGYRRTLFLPEEARGKRHFLQFDGAAHQANVYINGTLAGEHNNGYTAFRIEITNLVEYGAENIITVRLDSRESLNIPPFGYVIDYLTYGGLYRHVWHDERPMNYIEDVFVTTPLLDTAQVKIRISQANFPGTNAASEAVPGFLAEIRDADGNIVASQNHPAIEPLSGAAAMPGQVVPPMPMVSDGSVLAEQAVPPQMKPMTATGGEWHHEINFNIQVPGAKTWTPDTPNLYTLTIRMGEDEKTVTFGFRTVETTENEILLNGEPIFIRGLNRHQCWPYFGYAAADSLQVEDARILKEELHVNLVRTSHYPQSQEFIDACDRLGLLVFTEIPGWQHIGNQAWQDQAVENTREMLLQYRNHPSIILWGVRINESLDNDELYRRTNAVAHELDPSRPTTGVRYIENSSLLEDVYSYNDFSHEGDNPGCKKKSDVTKENKPLLISESNGHMFPTKSYDPWQKRQEHALRHARVLDAAMADSRFAKNPAANDSGKSLKHQKARRSKDAECTTCAKTAAMKRNQEITKVPGHAGAIQWCMFDYATHKDFGSGDRICYHGVMDSFRNPKLAAALYASQEDAEPILELGSPMDIGDYAAGRIDSIYAFTNADSVRLYKNGEFVKEFEPTEWDGLAHGPILIDDLIGCLLEKHEGMRGRQEKLVREALVAAGKYGLPNLPLRYKAQLAYCMARYHMSFDRGVELYGKYIGSWGGDSTGWRLDAIKDGQVVKSLTRVPTTDLHLEVKASTATLRDTDTYDMSALRIRIADACGATASYAQLPVRIEAEGPIEILGPDVVTAEGGMCGTYIRSIGEAGAASITIRTDQTEPVVIAIECIKEK